MRGTIKAYSLSVNAGVIECEHGNTYDFREADWQGVEAPAPNRVVQFDGVDRKAVKVRAAL